MKLLFSDGDFFEGPRWHDGAWWVSDIFGATVWRIAPDGKAEVAATVEEWPSGLGWLPDGTLDTDFGTNGVLVLGETYGSTTLCFPADMAVYNERLVIVDSCNARLVRLTLDGAFIDERALGGMFAGRVKVEGATLWISTLNFDALSQLHVALVALDDAFVQVESVELDARIGQIESFAVDDAGIWASGYDGVLHRATRDGTADVGFSGGLDALDVPGANQGLSVLAPLSDGRVVGLDRSANQLEVFSEAE